MMSKRLSVAPGKPSGFTLIELLTVMVIIAVLMGILIPAIYAVQQTVRKTQALTALTNVSTAIQSYRSDYFHLPLDRSANGNDLTIATKELNGSLMNILRGLDDENNPRREVYITLDDARNQAAPASGIHRDTGALMDPWGQSYCFMLDTNYDNRIDTNPKSGGAAPLHRPVIGWSLGKEGDVNLSGVMTW